jgi:hypothetical protein
LNLEVQAMYSYGERSQSKLFQVNTFFLLWRVNATRSSLGLHGSGGPQERTWGRIVLLTLTVLSLPPKIKWHCGAGFILGLLFFKFAALRTSYGQAGRLVELVTVWRLWWCHFLCWFQNDILVMVPLRLNILQMHKSQLASQCPSVN